MHISVLVLKIGILQWMPPIVEVTIMFNVVYLLDCIVVVPLIFTILTRLTRQVPSVERELYIRSTWVHPRFDMGFVLLDF